jgi:hypothetical protein
MSTLFEQMREAWTLPEGAPAPSTTLMGMALRIKDHAHDLYDMAELMDQVGNTTIATRLRKTADALHVMGEGMPEQVLGWQIRETNHNGDMLAGLLTAATKGCLVPAKGDANERAGS